MDLYGKLAPQTVSSFIFLAQQKFYDHVPVSPADDVVVGAVGASVR